MANDPINWFGNQTFLPQSQQTQMPYGPLPEKRGYANAPQQDPNQPPAWFLAFLNQGQQQPQAPSYGPQDSANALKRIRMGNRYDMSGNLLTGDPVADQEAHNKMWATTFGGPVQDAIRAAGQKRELARIAFNELPANERMNANMGFTPDMTPEQKREIGAQRASMRTGMPMSYYMPAPELDVTQAGTGEGAYRFVSGGYGTGYSRPGGADVKGTINGQPSSNYGAGIVNTGPAQSRANLAASRKLAGQIAKNPKLFGFL